MEYISAASGDVTITAQCGGSSGACQLTVWTIYRIFQDPPGVKRGQIVTFAVDVNPDNVPLTYEWKYIWSEGTVTRDPTTSNIWEGKWAAPGTVEVKGTIDGDSETESHTVSYTSRIPWEAIYYTPSFGAPDTTSEGDDPPTDSSTLGRMFPNMSNDCTLTSVTSGPNQGIWYVLSHSRLEWSTTCWVCKGLYGKAFIDHNPYPTYKLVQDAVYDHEYMGRDNRPGHTKQQENGYNSYRSYLVGATESPVASSVLTLSSAVGHALNERWKDIQNQVNTKADVFYYDEFFVKSSSSDEWVKCYLTCGNFLMKGSIVQFQERR